MKFLLLQYTCTLDDDPDNVLSKFLPELKELNMNDLNIYLLSELAISNDDLIRLTEAPQLPKSRVALNLYHTIKSRHTLIQFLKALKRSSEENPWHRELHEKISKERERRMASKRRSKSLRLSKVKHSKPSFFSLPGEVERHSSEYRIQDDEETVGQLKSELKDENERHLQLSSSAITISALPCLESSPSHPYLNDQMAERNEQAITQNPETERLKCKLHSSGSHMSTPIHTLFKAWYKATFMTIPSEMYVHKRYASDVQTLL